MQPRAAGLLVGLFLLAGCGVEFIDVEPPQIERMSRELRIDSRDEPLIFGIVFDLHIQDPVVCADTMRVLAERVRSVMLGRSASATELPTIDISPNCRQNDNRAFPDGAFADSIRAEERRLGISIRPVLVYFNNIDLYLPPSMVISVGSLRTWERTPLIWAIAPSSATAGQWADSTTPWVSSDDRQFQAKLNAWATKSLPFVSRATEALNGIPLLPEGTSGVQSFKVCAAVTGVQPAGFTPDGRTVPFIPEQPPRVFLVTPDVRWVTRDTYQGESFSIQLEICRANCDRFIERADGTTERWSTLSTCALPPR